MTKTGVGSNFASNLLSFSDAAFVNVDNNFRDMENNNISFVSNKTFENLPQLTSL
jgi:hypothetical protein